MSFPAVSVLLPVYNAQPYLAAAIESILAQTFSDFELLILDDGSRDRSPAIAAAYAAQDSRVSLIQRENRGLVPTLNQLAGLAKGDFLARMDADDIALPDRLAHQVAFLQQHSECVCVGGAFELIDPQGHAMQMIDLPEENASIQQKLLLGQTVINHPCALIRRSAFEQIGGYCAAMPTVEDLDLFLRLGEVGTLANLKEPVLQYRFHPQSVSAQYAARQKHQARLACEQAWKRRGTAGSFDFYTPWYRPDSDPESQHQFRMTYGWLAFNQGLRRTACINGVHAIGLQPQRLDGWKLLLSALIKRNRQSIGEK